MNRIAQLRSEKGWSQQDLADAAKVSQRSISRWERGEVSLPFEKAVLIASALGVSLDEFKGDPCESPRLSSMEQELVDRFGVMDPDAQDIILRLSRYLTQAD